MIEKIRESKFAVLTAVSILAAASVFPKSISMSMVMLYVAALFVWLGMKSITGIEISRAQTNPALAKEVKTAFVSNNQSEKEAVFLKDTKFTPDELDYIIEHGSTLEKEYAAMNPLTSISSLEKMRKTNEDKGVLSALIANPRLSKNAQDYTLEKIELLFPVNYQKAEVEAEKEAPKPKKEETVLGADKTDYNNPTSLAKSKGIMTNPEGIVKLRSMVNYEVMEAFLSNNFITKEALEIFEPMVIERNSVNQIVQNKSINLPLISMAYIASKAPAFRNGLVIRIAEKDNRYSGIEPKIVIQKILGKG